MSLTIYMMVALMGGDGGNEVDLSRIAGSSAGTGFLHAGDVENDDAFLEVGTRFNVVRDYQGQFLADNFTAHYAGINFGYKF